MKKKLLALLVAAAIMLSFVPATVLAAGDTTEIVSASLTLNGLIDLNVMVNAGSMANLDGYQMKAVVGDSVREATAGGVYGQDESGNNLFRFSFALPVKYLMQAVSLTLLDAAGSEVAAQTWTLADYTGKLKADPVYGSDQRLIALLNSLNDYGSYAAYYVDPAGTAPSSAAVETVTAQTVAGHRLSVQGDILNLKPRASLVLDNACDLVFKLDEAALEGCEVFLDGEAASALASQSGTDRVYTVPEILAQNWAHKYTLSVTKDGAEILNVQYSVLSYVYTVLKSAASYGTGLRGLLQSMYNYYGAAVSYGAKSQTLLWSVEEAEPRQINMNNASDGRNTSGISIADNIGLNDSQALKYERVTAGSQMTHTFTMKSPADYGFRTDVATQANDDIVWLWIRSNLSVKEGMQLNFNNYTLGYTADSYIYTIVNENGSPAMRKIGVDETVNGMTLYKHSSSASRIELDVQASGWIGIPMDQLGTPITAGTEISNLAVLLYQRSGDYSQQQVGDYLALDEFWLTSANTMPNLSAAELLYRVQVTTPSLALSGRYADAMIFQADKPWQLHGEAEAGSTVTVTLLNGQDQVATGSAQVENGAWAVTMPAVSGSYQEYTVRVSDGTTTEELNNIVFGQVWAAGGQSNMAYAISNITTAQQQAALQTALSVNDKADYIRFYTQSAQNGQDQAKTEPIGSWGRGSNWDQVLTASATGVYFAMEMQEALDMPVGIVVAAVGGTGITSWVDPAVAQTHSEYYALIQAKKYDNLTSQEANNYLDYLGGWYNSRVAPWSGYEVSGIVWYQGEHERSGNFDVQRLGLPAMVESWSNVFNSQDAVEQLPLVAIQIAPFGDETSDPSLSNNYLLNEAMRQGVAVVAQTGKAVCVSQYDLYVTVNDIHPQNKPELAARVAQVANALVYTEADVYTGPTVADVTYGDGSVTVTFDNVGQGLRYIQLNETDNYRILNDAHEVDTSDFFLDKLNGFSIWTGTGILPVDAVIQGTDTVVITLEPGTAVAGVYYAYGHEVLSANLFGSTGLPAEPFRHVNENFELGSSQVELWSPAVDINTLVEERAGADDRNPATVSLVTTGGLNNTSALKYALTGVGQKRTQTWNTTTAALEAYGFDANVTVAAADDILWVWVNAQTATTQRLQLSVNSKALASQTGAYIYTIVDDGTGAPVMQQVLYSETAPSQGVGFVKYSAAQAQILLQPGWSGWVGMPLSMLENGGVTAGEFITNLGVLLYQKEGDAAEQVLGDAVLLDGFWLTSAGLMPDLSNGELLYQAPVQLWSGDSVAAQQINMNNASDGRNTSGISIAEGVGLSGSQALKYERITAGSAMTHTYNWNSPQDYGFRTGVKTKAADDILWFWISADLSTVETTQFSVNGTDISSAEGSYIYTIVDNDGQPAMQKIEVGSTVNGMKLYAHGSSGNCRIELQPGTSGWIGIPMDQMKAPIEAGSGITKLSILLNKLGSDFSEQRVGDALIRDEYWLTAAGTMPGLSDAELLYRAPIRLWSADEVDAQVIVENYVNNNQEGNRNKITLSIAEGAGLNGTQALKYEKSEMASGKAMSSSYALSGLDTYGFRTSVDTREADDVLWFWLYADLSVTETAQLSVNGVNISSGEGSYIYTVVNNGDQPELATLTVGGDGANGMKLYQHGTNNYCRIELQPGASGWMGIPMDQLVTPIAAGHNVTGLSILLNQKDGSAADQMLGDALVLDEFWLTANGDMPRLSTADLLYAPVTPEAQMLMTLENLTAGDLLEGITADSRNDTSTVVFYNASGNSNYSNCIFECAEDIGRNGLNALKIGVQSGNSLTYTCYTGLKLNIAAQEGVTAGSEALFGADAVRMGVKANSMLWFYMDTTGLAVDAARLDVRVNNTQKKGPGYYYTIENGGAVREDLVSGATNATVSTAVASDTDGTAIPLSKGFRGWLGVPLSNYTTAATLDINNVALRLQYSTDKLTESDSILISDLHIGAKFSNSWAMPDLEIVSDSAAYYTAADYVADPSLFVPAWQGQLTVPQSMLSWEEKFQQFFTPNGRLMSVAHRGDRNNYYPENSLEGILSVIYAGADVVEVDVTKTKDGIPVVIHDDTLTRTTNLTQLRQEGLADGLPESDNVADWTLAQIRQLRLITLATGEATNYVVPTLEDVLLIAKDRVFVTLDKVHRFDWTTDIVPVIESTGALETVMIPYDYCAKLGTETVASYIDYLKNAGARNVAMATWVSASGTISADTISAAVQSIVDNSFPLALRCTEYTPGDTTFDVLYGAYVGSYRLYFETLTGTNDNATVWEEMEQKGINLIMGNSNIYALCQYIGQTQFT